MVTISKPRQNARYADSDLSVLAVGRVGTADDTAVLETALATGRRVLIPAGVTVTVTADVILRSGAGLVGQGRTSRLRLIADTNPATRANNRKIRLADNATVRDLSVEEVGVTGRHGVYGSVFGEGVTGCHIENVEIFGSSSTGIFFINSTDCDVRDCFIHDIWADGVHAQRGSKRISVTGCTIVRVEDDGIAFVSHDFNTYGPVEDCVAANNIIRDIRKTGSGIVNIGAIGSTIEGNLIRDTPLAGIRIASASFGAEGSIVGGFVQVIGNKIRNVGNRADIPGERGGIFIEGSRYVQVEANQIRGTGTTGIALSNAWADVTIRGNQIAVTGDVGIFVSSADLASFYLGLWNRPEFATGEAYAYATGHRLAIEGNELDSCALSGIYVSGAPTRRIQSLTIVGNRMNRLKTFAGGGSSYGYFVANADGLTIRDNRNTNPVNGLALTWYIDQPTTSGYEDVHNTNVPRKFGFEPDAVTWRGILRSFEFTRAPIAGEGAFQVGDEVNNINAATGVGKWICTAAGSPGTWLPWNIN